MLEGQTWLNFYRAIKSPESRKVYARAVQDFMKFTKSRTPEELLQSDKQTIETNIMQYIVSQTDAGLSSSVIRMRVAAIRLFYKMNRMSLEWEIIGKYIHTTKKLKDRPYGREEIKKMLGKADQRAKVMILLECSTGIRIGALPGLSINSLKKIDDLYQITAYEGEGEEYITYCTPECARAIEDYLDFRQRMGEKLKPAAPLLREWFDKSDPIKAQSPRRLKQDYIRQVVGSVAIDAGIFQRTTLIEGQSPGRIRREVKQNHGLRKFFDTEATKAGVHPLYVELLQGHSIALKGSYFKPTANDLLRGNDRMGGYVEAIDALTINEENRLKKQVVELKQKESVFTARLDKYDAFYEEFRPFLDELKSQGLKFPP